MSPSKTIFTIMLFLPLCVLYTNTMIGMDEYPQLQLQEPKKNPIKAVNAKLQIIGFPAYSTSSMTKPNQKICFHGCPPRYINDPLILVHLSLEDNIVPQTNLAIPAKQLFNLNDGSVIQFSIFDAKTPNNSLFITATCQTNPKDFSQGKTFYEQFESTMNCFYKNPELITEDDTVKLLAEKVITERHQFDAIPFPGAVATGEIIRQHGERGCPNEKTLVKLITKPKIKPYGNSIHQFVAQRQLGIKPRSTVTTDLNRILDNCLRVMELEAMAENNTLDECFRELQISCLLTRLFIKTRITKLCIEFLARQR